VDGIVGPRKSRDDPKNFVLTGRLTVIYMEYPGATDATETAAIRTRVDGSAPPLVQPTMC
jgi:hypothetical protein